MTPKVNIPIQMNNQIRVAMPEGKRVAVCVTFDFDGMSMFFAGGTITSQTISRGEFDARVGVPRLLDILERFQMPATWFVPGHTAETWPTLTRQISKAGHELAHHGYCHECPLSLSVEDEERVLIKGMEALYSVADIRPVGYRAPKWDPSSNTVELLVRHGFEYASNGMACDYQPYFARIGDIGKTDAPFVFGRESSLVEVPSYWYLSDVVQLENVLDYGNRISVSPREVENIWKSEFDYLYDLKSGGVITYAFHPSGVGRGYRAAMLTRLIEHISQHNDVWLTTCQAVAAGFRSGRDERVDDRDDGVYRRR